MTQLTAPTTKTSRYGIPALVLLSLLALGGCSSANMPGVADYDAAAPSVPMEVGEEAEPGEDTSAVVITGTITITTDEPLEAAEHVTEVVNAAGGRVSARHETSASTYSSERAELTLRIPADRVDSVREQLAELGRVDVTRFESTEVGATQRDLNARISTLRTSISRYTAWLEQTDDVEDLIALEQAISDRQSQLERLEAEQRALNDLVALSTIELTLRTTVTAGDPPATTFGEGLVRGWDGFLAFFAALFVGLGYALPWLVLLGIIAFVTVWMIRRRIKRRPRVAPATQHPIPPQQQQAAPTPQAPQGPPTGA